MRSGNYHGRGRAAAWTALVSERLIGLALALLLLRSAFAHLGNPYAFLSAVYAYEIVGIEVGKWIAIVVPSLQTVAAVCLLARWWIQEAYFLAFCLFATFAAAQVLVLRQGLKISCGCFGSAGSLQVGRLTLTLAGAAAVASLLGWGLDALRARGSRAAPSERPSHVPSQPTPGLHAD